MTFSSEGAVAYLQGDLTHSGVTNKLINSLAVFLQQIVSRGGKHIRIDCSRIKASDISGLQLLYAWMKCARSKGIEPELVNFVHCHFTPANCSGKNAFLRKWNLASRGLYQSARLFRMT